MSFLLFFLFVSFFPAGKTSIASCLALQLRLCAHLARVLVRQPNAEGLQ